MLHLVMWHWFYGIDYILDMCIGLDMCISFLSTVWGKNHSVGLLSCRWTAVPEGVSGLLARSYSRSVGSAMVECTVQKEAAALHHAPLLVPLLEIESWRKTPTAQVWGSFIAFDQYMHLQFVRFYLRFYILALFRLEVAGLFSLLGTWLCSSGLTGLSVSSGGSVHACFQKGPGGQCPWSWLAGTDCSLLPQRLVTGGLLHLLGHT